MLRSSDRREIAEMINAALRRLGERISGQVGNGRLSESMTASELAEVLGSSGAAEIECELCGATVETLGDAMAEDWHASYWMDAEEMGNPICPKCAAEKCRVSDDGELELIQETPAAAPTMQIELASSSPPAEGANCATITAVKFTPQATPATDCDPGESDEVSDAANLARLETAESALGRAARALYMLGSPAAVNLGERIEPILGEVQEMLKAARRPPAKAVEAELPSGDNREEVAKASEFVGAASIALYKSKSPELAKIGQELEPILHKLEMIRKPSL